MGTETQGVGKSKKAAEQDAARQALALISTS
jgi:dsRNA-specific ribonuclease